MKTRLLIYGLILFIILLGSIIICLGITGKGVRPYSVLNPTDLIKIASETLSVEETVQIYAPILFQKSNFPAGAPQKLFYEVQINKSEILILYRPFWFDEDHPVAPLDFLYDLFREIYYGSIIDAEPIQLKINNLTGEVEEIYFQMDPTHKLDVFLPRHYWVFLRLVSQNNYSLIVQNQVEGFISPLWQEKRILLEVETWNHLFNLYSNESLEKYETLALEPFTEEFYQQFKTVRRETGPAFAAPSDFLDTAFLTVSVICAEIIVFLMILLRLPKKFVLYFKKQ